MSHLEERRLAGRRPAGASPLIPEGLDAFIVLLRHGETDAIVAGRFQGQAESALTPAGDRQLALAGRRLARREPPLPLPEAPPQVIVHSPLARAARSAALVVDAFRDAGIDAPLPRPEPRFNEIAQGGWEGLTHDEIGARFGDSLALWRRWPVEHHAPGGESLEQVAARADAGLRSVLADLAEGASAGTLDRHQVLGYPGHRVPTDRWALIVAHAGIFRVLVCRLLDLGLEHFWNVDFAPGAISVVEIRAGRGVLRALNLDAHLGAALEPGAVAETSERDATGAL